jgi:copper chaperone CopZ
MRKSNLGMLAVMWVGLTFAAEPRTVVMDVENMTCPTCRLTIERALDKVLGVAERHVDTRASTVKVTFDPARTSESVVARSITDAGFPAKVRANGG